MSIRSTLEVAKKSLPASESAALDAELLLQFVLDCDRSYFYSHPEQNIDDNKLQLFQSLIDKRSEGVPIAYLLGNREFWSLRLEVNEHTLIPRPETESLVEKTLSLIAKDAKQNILDLGTGTGAIVLALASERKACAFIATDISEAALDVAKRNATLHKLENITFIRSDWFSGLGSMKFDVIVSNPPYIADNDPHLQQGDIRFEPKQALVSGTDGLADIRSIVKESLSHLNTGGNLLIEHGYDQGDAVLDIFQSCRFVQCEPIYDLSGTHRATLGRPRT